MRNKNIIDPNLILIQYKRQNRANYPVLWARRAEKMHMTTTGLFWYLIEEYCAERAVVLIKPVSAVVESTVTASDAIDTALFSAGGNVTF